MPFLQELPDPVVPVTVFRAGISPRQRVDPQAVEVEDDLVQDPD
jgi:hypothetical protein